MQITLKKMSNFRRQISFTLKMVFRSIYINKINEQLWMTILLDEVYFID